jgi:hypothetical protein
MLYRGIITVCADIHKETYIYKLRTKHGIISLLDVVVLGFKKLYFIETLSISFVKVCISNNRNELSALHFSTYLFTPWSRDLLDKITGSCLSRNSPHFMEPEGSLTHSHVLATCSYPEPA